MCEKDKKCFYERGSKRVYEGEKVPSRERERGEEERERVREKERVWEREVREREGKRERVNKSVFERDKNVRI